MIVRNVNDREVLNHLSCHGGAIAQMILDRRILQEIGFLLLQTWQEKGHRKPQRSDGGNLLRIEWGREIPWTRRRSTQPRRRHLDSAGSSHSLTNSTEKDLLILVIASPNW